MYRQSRLSVKRKNETRKSEPTPLTISIDISYWKNVRVTHLKQQLSLTSVVEPVMHVYMYRLAEGLGMWRFQNSK